MKDDIAKYEDEGKTGKDLERLKDEMIIQKQIAMVLSKQSVIQEKINLLIMSPSTDELSRLKEMFQNLVSQRTLLVELTGMISEGKLGDEF